MKYDIWIEGYCCTGNSSTAHCIAEGIEADSFLGAVKKWYDEEPDTKNRYGELSIRDNVATLWGCELFDNETDARKSFG